MTWMVSVADTVIPALVYRTELVVGVVIPSVV
jgi:hypothetical protein